MIVVLDSSVWVSALEFGGTPDLAVVHALTHDQLAISNFIRTEVFRILTEKFAHAPEELDKELDELFLQALWIEVTGEVRGVCRDPKDDAVLETAWKANAEYLVAGDKDLLSLRQFRETTIISPAHYLDLQ